MARRNGSAKKQHHLSEGINSFSGGEEISAL